MTQVETGTTVFGDRLGGLRRPEAQPARARARSRRRAAAGRASGRRGDAAEARADAVARFCRGLIDAAAPSCVAVKPQLAFFEALGLARHARLRETRAPTRARRGLLVIADAKRGDIGSTARAYAAAYVEPRDGGPPRRRRDHRQPVPRPRVGRAVPRRRASATAPASSSSRRRRTRAAPTSRISGSRDGEVVWQSVARLAREWGEDHVGEHGLSSVGLVIGATYPRAVGEARRLCPQQVLLLPGIGAQGAGPADVARAFTSGPASALVAVSRAIDYAFRARGGDWRTAARRRGGPPARRDLGRLRLVGRSR